jgi:hypothetical protein
MVAGLGRIGVAEVIPVLTQSLQTDLDKDVRLQVVDSFQRLYILSAIHGPNRDDLRQGEERICIARQTACPQCASVNPAVNAALADSMQKDFSRKCAPQRRGLSGHSEHAIVLP